MAEAYLGESTKKLGFGLMRLPRIEGSDDVIDIEQTKEMVDLFLEAGCTYFDTAWIYQGSEEAMRKALVERHPRESYTIATKNVPAPAILTIICCTIWGRTGPVSLMNWICGPLLLR